MHKEHPPTTGTERSSAAVANDYHCAAETNATIVYVYTTYTPAQKRACQKYRQREDIKERTKLYMREYRKRQKQILLPDAGTVASV